MSDMIQNTEEPDAEDLLWGHAGCSVQYGSIF